MIYQEYACYYEPKLHNAKQNIFKAIELGVKGISTHITYLPKIADILPKHITISCPIDFPEGHSDTELKIHYITRAIQCGANTVDVVANIPLFYLNSSDFLDELKVLDKLCLEKQVDLRIMVDSRKLVDQKEITDILSIIGSTSIHYVFCNTGQYIDDHNDSLILCKQAEKLGINAIINGRINTKDQMDTIIKSSIYGIRFHSISTLSRLGFGV